MSATSCYYCSIVLSYTHWTGRCKRLKAVLIVVFNDKHSTFLCFFFAKMLVNITPENISKTCQVLSRTYHFLKWPIMFVISVWRHKASWHEATAFFLHQSASFYSFKLCFYRVSAARTLVLGSLQWRLTTNKFKSESILVRLVFKSKKKLKKNT